MAIGKLFDIVGETIVPKQDCFIIEPIRAVIHAFPEDHPKILAFLHYMKSLNPDDNPYADVPFSERAEQILYDLKLDIDLEDDIIKDAMQCVEEKYYTTIYGIYRGMKILLDKAGTKLGEADLNFDQRTGNSNNIKAWLKDFKDLTSSFKGAYREFEEEQGGIKVRGGGTLADDEDKDY